MRPPRQTCRDYSSRSTEIPSPPSITRQSHGSPGWAARGSGFPRTELRLSNIPACTRRPCRERWENNYAVWALKRGSSAQSAPDDFEKLDEMFATLHYPLGFFININAQQDFLDHYPGPFRDRLYGFYSLLRSCRLYFYQLLYR